MQLLRSLSALPVLGTVAPDALLAALFLAVWISPTTLGEQALAWCTLMMLLEFIIVHSSAFYGHLLMGTESRGRKIRGGALLGLFYTLFVAGFALAFKSWWPVVSFWILIANRMLPITTGVTPSGAEGERMQRTSAASAIFYLSGVFVTLFLPLPRLGITDQVIAATNIGSSGEWVEHPEKVVAFGMLYFAAMAVSGLRGHAWTAGGIPKRREGSAARGRSAGGVKSSVTPGQPPARRKPGDPSGDRTKAA